jgi:predicted Zn finger-like uncharacterized protein
MIIQCQGCAAKYFLPEDKVPENPIKVRCPKCTAVFTLAPAAEPVTAGVAAGTVPGMAAAPESIAADAAPVQTEPVTPVESEAVAAPPQEPEAAATPPQEPEATATPPQAPVAAPEADPTPKPAKPAKAKGKGRSKEARAKRLARVLVSDILCYNQDKRDQALQDGTLMTVLGEEIKKSWELYKDKVGPDVASSTNYFKEALNEILADGQEVF